MKLRLLHLAALAAFFGSEAAPAGAAPALEPPVSTLALRVAGFGDGKEPGLAPWSREPRPRLESNRYRPRRRYYSEPEGSGRSSGFSQIHGGFFDPDGDPARGFLLGVRGGTSIDQRIQLGVGLDWNRRSDRQTTVVREVPLPGGGTAQQSVVRTRSSSDLFPIMAVLQVSPGIDSPLLPYFGVGGGYEVLRVSAQDFDTGQDFDATYGGWGWQVWGGLAFPLSGRTRFNTEVFLNGAEVERDVDDPSFGGRVREIVDMDGVGVRAGLSWGF